MILGLIFEKLLPKCQERQPKVAPWFLQEQQKEFKTFPY